MKFNESQILEAIAEALEVPEVSSSDSHLSLDVWDSLGQLSIQAILGSLTNGESDKIEELPLAYSAEAILRLLRSAGIVD